VPKLGKQRGIGSNRRVQATRPLLLVAVHTGPRGTEPANLRFRDIHLGAGCTPCAEVARTADHCRRQHKPPVIRTIRFGRA
jgi:hypothetical protein